VTADSAVFIESQFFGMGMEVPAEAHLQRELRRRPGDAALLALQGDIARSRGDIGAARAAYVAAAAAGTDPRHRFLASVLSASVPETAAPVGTIWPGPFVRHRDFLPAPLQAELMEFALQNFERFAPARVTGDRWNTEKPIARSGRCMDVLAEFEASFGPHLATCVADVAPRIQVPPFEHDGFELQMTRYGDGDFFISHRDVEITDPGAPESRRRIAFVYYFSKRPRPFGGGDLLIYDSDRTSPAADPMKFTRVHPEDNSIALFPTQVLHEVTPVVCSSTEVEDGRLTINGWIHG